MKIYLAGKVAKGDWRHQFVPELRNVLDHEVVDASDVTVLWPRFIQGFLSQHDYVGPFFASCDHGCSHAPTSHGIGRPVLSVEEEESEELERATLRSHEMWLYESDPARVAPDQLLAGCGPVKTRAWVFGASMQGIGAADTVFCWLDREDAYGTLVELGYALALRETRGGPQIWVTGPCFFPELWFAYHTADRVFVGQENNPWNAYMLVSQPHQPDGTAWRRWAGADPLPRLVAAEQRGADAVGSLLRAGQCVERDDKSLSVEYRSYLASQEWARKRTTALRLAGNTCQRCGRTGGTLQVHHRTYRRLGHEESTDLEVLCGDCHERSDMLRKSLAVQDHWTRRVSGWAAKRHGENWEDDHDFDDVAEEFRAWLAERGESP